MKNNENGKFWYLEKFELTQKLKRDEILNMEKSMVMKKVDKNTFLHFPEMKDSYVYFLKEGMIKIVHTSESGEEQIKYIITPGNIFGELSMLGHAEDSNDLAVAMSDCVVCFMKVKDLKMMMEVNSSLATHVNKLVGFRIKRIERKLESLIFKNARTRVIEFMLDLAKDYGHPEGNSILVKSFLSHEDIAKITSTSRQTVTIVLNELKETGSISYNSKHYILNTSSLALEL